MRDRCGVFLVMLLALGSAVRPERAAAQISPGPLSHAHRALEGNGNCFRCHGGGKRDAMDAQCLGCHREVGLLAGSGRGLHAREGRADCARCHPEHAGKDFTLATLGEGAPEKFDHQRAGWPLEGKHRVTECRRCHQISNQKDPVASSMQRTNPGQSWLGLSTSCVSCHADVHQGRLGADCASCHSAASWQNVPAARFDHARTRYPLAGRHAAVECVRCHPKDAPAGTQARFAECVDCHADAHAGQAMAAGRIQDCSACHTVEGFAKTTFDRARHAESAFPLTGAHARAECAGCHPRLPDAGTVRSAGKDRTRVVAVSSLREDSGRGAFGREASGREASGREESDWGRARVLLLPSSSACTDCHLDAHAGQLTRDGVQPDCKECHRTSAWRPTIFDRGRHASARLSLDGAHAGLDCVRCHGPKRPNLSALPGNDVTGPAGSLLRPLEPACVSCHQNPHGERLARAEAGGADPCVACHSVESFRLTRVDTAAHARYRYPLEGAHRATPCQLCHRDLERPKPASTLALAAAVPALHLDEVGRECSSCHRDPHEGQFEGRAGGASCDRCHSVERFRAAERFDHDRATKFALTGGHRGVACDRCHHAEPRDGAASVVRYRPLSAECRSCHAGEMLPAGHGGRADR